VNNKHKLSGCLFFRAYPHHAYFKNIVFLEGVKISIKNQ
jgi:hypothetical protein